MRLNSEAREQLKAAGVTQVGWARRFYRDDKWHGDACGCPDDRCIGFHHDRQDDCGCLPALLDERHRMSTDDRREAQEVARSAISDDVQAKLKANPDHATYILLSSMDAGVDALLAAGYRLVSDDADTVERVAKAIAHAGAQSWPTSTIAREYFRDQARAAIAALKENQ